MGEERGAEHADSPTGPGRKLSRTNLRHPGECNFVRRSGVLCSAASDIPFGVAALLGRFLPRLGPPHKGGLFFAFRSAATEVAPLAIGPLVLDLRSPHASNPSHVTKAKLTAKLAKKRRELEAW